MTTTDTKISFPVLATLLELPVDAKPDADGLYRVTTQWRRDRDAYETRLIGDFAVRTAPGDVWTLSDEPHIPEENWDDIVTKYDGTYRLVSDRWIAGQRWGIFVRSNSI